MPGLFSVTNDVRPGECRSTCIRMTLYTANVLCFISLLLSSVAVRAQAQPNGAAAIATEEIPRVIPNEAAVARSGGYQPLTGNERWNLYLRRAFWSPGVFLRAAGPALGAQQNNEPPSWGQGMEGYSRRFANRFGRFALQETYEAAGAAALGHEVRYIRSKRSGFFPRAGHALISNLVTYDRRGRRTPHVARIGSVFGAEFTGKLWMPPGYTDNATAMRGVGVQLGVSSGFNLIREFAPELKRLFTWK